MATSTVSNDIVSCVYDGRLALYPYGCHKADQCYICDIDEDTNQVRAARHGYHAPLVPASELDLSLLAALNVAFQDDLARRIRIAQHDSRRERKHVASPDNVVGIYEAEQSLRAILEDTHGYTYHEDCGVWIDCHGFEAEACKQLKDNAPHIHALLQAHENMARIIWAIERKEYSVE